MSIHAQIPSPFSLPESLPGWRKSENSEKKHGRKEQPKTETENCRCTTCGQTLGFERQEEERRETEAIRLAAFDKMETQEFYPRYKASTYWKGRVKKDTRVYGESERLREKYAKKSKSAKGKEKRGAKTHNSGYIDSGSGATHSPIAKETYEITSNS